jgi:hypothetical protein
MRILGSPVSAKAIALCFLPLLLAGCDVMVQEGPVYRPPPPRPHPQFCTREYAPVCARRGPDRQTFANGCLADRAGYRIVSRGECRRGGEDDDDGRPAFCTREYAPVCASRRGQTRTFPNACEARAADWRIIGEGSC